MAYDYPYCHISRGKISNNAERFTVTEISSEFLNDLTMMGMTQPNQCYHNASEIVFYMNNELFNEDDDCEAFYVLCFIYDDLSWSYIQHAVVKVVDGDEVNYIDPTLQANHRTPKVAYEVADFNETELQHLQECCDESGGFNTVSMIKNNYGVELLDDIIKDFDIEPTLNWLAENQ